MPKFLLLTVSCPFIWPTGWGFACLEDWGLFGSCSQTQNISMSYCYCWTGDHHPLVAILLCIHQHLLKQCSERLKYMMKRNISDFVSVSIFLFTWPDTTRGSVKFRGRSDIEWSSVVRLDLGRDSCETRLDLGDQLLTCPSHPSCSQSGNNLSCGRAPDNIPVFLTKHHWHWTIFGRSVRKLYLF